MALCVQPSPTEPSCRVSRRCALGGGVWWPNAEWYTRVGLLHAFAQNDVVLNETPTDGYNLLNERIRNHIFFKKAEVLQPGLGARLFTNVKF